MKRNIIHLLIFIITIYCYSLDIDYFNLQVSKDEGKGILTKPSRDGFFVDENTLVYFKYIINTKERIYSKDYQKVILCEKDIKNNNTNEKEIFLNDIVYCTNKFFFLQRNIFDKKFLGCFSAHREHEAIDNMLFIYDKDSINKISFKQIKEFDYLYDAQIFKYGSIIVGDKDNICYLSFYDNAFNKIKDLVNGKGEIIITIGNDNQTIFFYCNDNTLYQTNYPFDKEPVSIKKFPEMIISRMRVNPQNNLIIMQEGPHTVLYNSEKDKIEKMNLKYELIGDWISAKEFLITSDNQILKINADNLETEKISEKGMLLFAINKWNGKIFLSKIPKVD